MRFSIWIQKRKERRWRKSEFLRDSFRSSTHHIICIRSIVLLTSTFNMIGSFRSICCVCEGGIGFFFLDKLHIIFTLSIEKLHTIQKNKMKRKKKHGHWARLSWWSTHAFLSPKTEEKKIASSHFLSYSRKKCAEKLKYFVTTCCFFC